jgi:redox-sensitive bicupin YhaK (pirin superfamily)
MIAIRRADERGHANHGWLDSHHTFSFADYFDERHMGFRGLRVINEDRVVPGKGFGTHPHRDMEIVSYVLAGALEHKDSMGNGSVIRPGDVQRLSAGTGITHSEFNASASDPVHFLQIWIKPSSVGLSPGYEQKHFADTERQVRLRLIASEAGADGAVRVHADVKLYAGIFSSGQSATIELARGRYSWVHVARGAVVVNGQSLRAGDALSLTDEVHLRIEGPTGAPLDGHGSGEVLVFDLA